MTSRSTNRANDQEVEITYLGLLSVFILGVCVGISLMHLYAQQQYDNAGWQTRRDAQVEQP